MDCSTRLDDSSGICFRENVYNTLRTYALHQSEACYSSDTLVVPVDHTTVPIVGINFLMYACSVANFGSEGLMSTGVLVVRIMLKANQRLLVLNKRFNATLHWP